MSAKPGISHSFHRATACHRARASAHIEDSTLQRDCFPYYASLRALCCPRPITEEEHASARITFLAVARDSVHAVLEERIIVPRAAPPLGIIHSSGSRIEVGDFLRIHWIVNVQHPQACEVIRLVHVGAADVEVVVRRGSIVRRVFTVSLRVSSAGASYAVSCAPAGGPWESASAPTMSA